MNIYGALNLANSKIMGYLKSKNIIGDEDTCSVKCDTKYSQIDDKNKQELLVANINMFAPLLSVRINVDGELLPKHLVEFSVRKRNLVRKDTLSPSLLKKDPAKLTNKIKLYTCYKRKNGYPVFVISKNPGELNTCGLLDKGLYLNEDYFVIAITRSDVCNDYNLEYIDDIPEDVLDKICNKNKKCLSYLIVEYVSVTEITSELPEVTDQIVSSLIV